MNNGEVFLPKPHELSEENLDCMEATNDFTEKQGRLLDSTYESNEELCPSCETKGKLSLADINCSLCHGKGYNHIHSKGEEADKMDTTQFAEGKFVSVELIKNSPVSYTHLTLPTILLV